MEEDPLERLDVRIDPAPSPDEHAAILAAVSQTLRREEGLATPSVWRLAGWVDQRVGVTDLARFLRRQRRWPLAARMPRGGRPSAGLNGRGDAK